MGRFSIRCVFFTTNFPWVNFQSHIFFIEVPFVFSFKSFRFHKLLPQLDVRSTNSSNDHSRARQATITSTCRLDVPA